MTGVSLGKKHLMPHMLQFIQLLMGTKDVSYWLSLKKVIGSIRDGISDKLILVRKILTCLGPRKRFDTSEK